MKYCGEPGQVCDDLDCDTCEFAMEIPDDSDCVNCGLYGKGCDQECEICPGINT